MAVTGGTLAFLTIAANAAAIGSVVRSKRRTAKATELTASKTASTARTGVAEEKDRLLEEEAQLKKVPILAREASLRERRSKQLRRTRSSTIVAGSGTLPNLTKLGQKTKTELGASA